MSIDQVIAPLSVSWDLVGRWSTRSQEQACRNAMAACTVLAARRLERLEVEEYIAEHLARLEAPETPVHRSVATRHVS